MSTVPVKILEWAPECAVDGAAIDREHKTLFGMIHRLHQAMLVGKGTELLGPLLKEVTGFTLLHFAHEEKLMAAVSYPGAPEMVRQHEGLRRKVAVFGERFGRGEITMTIEFTLFLAEWLKQHTMTTDRRLGEFLRARGGAPAPRR